jgi:thiamine biosynthesis lipoprotein
MQRRRFISILATSAAGLSLSRVAAAATPAPLQPVTWRGYTLGAEGSFTLYTQNPTGAQQVLQLCFTEIRRLEAVFSLYNSQSELSRLNRDGQLKNPSTDWAPLCAAISQAHRLTDGGFDPTIQPLWQAYAAHFATHPAATTGPTAATLAAARAQTGWQHVEYEARAIHFARPGIQLTLNGIAQGYITDRVSEILQDAGYKNVLVELGETRALGPHPEQRPWSIGIKHPEQPTQVERVIELNNQALATSGGYGSPFSKDGKFHHLIDPRSGRPSNRWSSLSVVAPTATQADALSTGLSFASAEQIRHIEHSQPELRIWAQSAAAPA